MAKGDVKWFASFIQKSKDGQLFDFTAGDSLKIGIITNAVVPSVTTADPRWGAGGTTNFATNQVATGTGYTGPLALANPTYVRAAGVNTLDADNVSIPQDAAGFTNGYYGIIYDDTNAGKYAVGFIDLGGPVGIQAGPIDINWNAAGILTETAS